MRHVYAWLIVGLLVAPAVASAQTSEEASTEAGARAELSPELMGDSPPGGDSEGPLESRVDTGIVVGGKLGAGFSQPFNDLGTSFVGELEVGYVLPLPEPIGHSIQAFMTGQYSAPTMTQSLDSSPRLPGDGIPRYEITQQQLILTWGALYRLPLPIPMFRPYAALGARLYMMRTLVEGEAGDEQFGENEETQSRAGIYGALGGDLFVGPGSAFLELQIARATLHGFIIRDTNAAALNIALGYRLFL